MPTVDVQDPVKLEMHSHLDRLMGQPLPTFQSALQGIKDWNPAHEWNQNVQNTMFGLGDTVRNVGHAIMHPIDTAKNLQNMPVPSAEEVAMAFNPGHIPNAGLAGAIKKVYYHGSSNDIAGGLRNPEQTGIIPTTGGPTNATFVSPSPEFASEFAGHRDLVPANAPPYPTGAAVYPVRLNVKKTFDVGNRKHVDSVLEKLNDPEGDVAGILDLTHDKVTRFKQGKMTPGAIHPDTYPAVERPEVLKAIKDAGFDSFYTTGSHWSEKDEMDKAVKNIGVFDPDKIEYAIPEAKKETRTAEENKAAYLEPSKEKGVWYHGTAADIKQFKPELGLEKADVSGTPYQAGATFVTQNPEFAHVFAKDSPSYMIQNPERHLTPEQMKSAAEDAKKYFKETYEDMPEHRDAMIKSIEEGKPIGEAQDALTEAYKPYLPSGPNIMPVHVRVTNPFDAAVPEHIDALKKVNPELPFKDMHRTSVLEIPEVQQAIKDAGFDSFYTNEAGNRNLGLFKPEQIKSAIGNEGTYDPANPVITKKDGGSVTVEDPIKLERFSKFEQEFVKRFDEGGLVTADKTQAPVEESAAFGIYPKSGVPSATPEAQAKALEFSKNLADLVVPQTTADVAMMAMPYGKVGKMIGAGLIAANPNEAGAAMFPRLAVGTLGFMAEHYPESFKAVKEALEKTLKTGNEYAVAHNPYETILHTSNKPDKVMMTPQMMSNMNETVYKPTDTFMMHTHPYGGVGPSKADIKMTAQNPARQIISSPQGDSIIAIDPGKRFSGNSYDSYIDDAQKHIQSEKVQNFLQSKGYLGYGQYNDIEGLASKMAPHEYLRNLATQNRLDYRYNDLGMHTPENSDLDAVPFADILESYWREFYPGSVVEKQPVKKAEGGQVKKKSTIDDLEEDPVLIEHKLKLMGLI